MPPMTSSCLALSSQGIAVDRDTSINQAHQLCDVVRRIFGLVPENGRKQ
jgi:hypothetical protein